MIDLLRVVVEYDLLQFLQKTLCCDQDLLCSASFYLLRSCLVLVSYNERNIPSLFLLTEHHH